MTNMNEIYLRRKLKVMLGSAKLSTEMASDEHVATAMKNFESLGFVFSEDLFAKLMTCSVEQVNNFYLEAIPVVREMVGANVAHNPMYPNFPKQVMETSNLELYINAIVHYWSAGTLFPNTEKDERLPLFEDHKVRVIDVGSEDDFVDIFMNLLKSKTSISKTDKSELDWFLLNECRPSVFSLVCESEIPLKENIALVASVALRRDEFSQMKHQFKTATDVLRFATFLSGGDVSLAGNTKYKSFKRSERRMLLDLLEGCNSLDEDMARYGMKWIRLGEKIHPREYQKRFPKTAETFRKIRENEKIKTFNSKVEEYYSAGLVTNLLRLLSERPGVFARSLDRLLRTFSNGSDSILLYFSDVANKVPTTILIQVLTHFRGRSIEGARVFFPKGNLAKVYGIENNLPELRESDITSIVDVCVGTLVKRFEEKESLGNVWINPILENFTVPFSQRSASKSLKPYVRGTKIPLTDYNTIRFFTYWERNFDIDLSAVMYDEDWNYMEHISYTNLKSSAYQSCHSGDITNGTGGVSEFIDVDLESARNHGVRYILPSLISFRGESFSEIKNCFVGWMNRNSPESGEIYDPKTVEDKIDIVSESTMVTPVIIDIVDNNVIWADMNIASRVRYRNVENSNDRMAWVGRSMTNVSKMNMYDLFLLHTKARGTLVETREEADFVFAEDGDVSPFDLDVIVSEYL